MINACSFFLVEQRTVWRTRHGSNTLLQNLSKHYFPFFFYIHYIENFFSLKETYVLHELGLWTCISKLFIHFHTRLFHHIVNFDIKTVVIQLLFNASICTRSFCLFWTPGHAYKRCWQVRIFRELKECTCVITSMTTCNSLNVCSFTKAFC